MRRFLKFAAFALIAAGLLSVPMFISSAESGTTVSVIVEFKDDPAAVHAAKASKQGAALSADQIRTYRNGLTAAQNQFLQQLQEAGIAAQLQASAVKNADGSVAGSVPLRYSLVFNGVTLTVPSSAVSGIASMPQVKKVHPNSMLYTDLTKSVDYIHAPDVYGQYAELTPFDDFREGYEGQGINISVIDTGIDWTHPMFGGDPSPPRLGISPNVAALNNASNQKVIYQLPLTDIVTDGFGHGTHVAATAAGYLALAPGADGLPNTSDDLPIHGVAPQAKLMSYKVCSDIQSTYGSAVRPSLPTNVNGVNVQALAPQIGGCMTSNIVMAIEDSVSPQTIDLQPKPIAHVINMSLGGSGGPDNPTAIASDNATLTGCIVVAAAGNSGPGDGTVGAPAAGIRVMATGAATDPGSGAGWSFDVLAASAVNRNQAGAVTPANNLPAAAGERSQVRLFPMAGTPAPPANSLAQYAVFVRNGQTPDEYPANVSGRIALVKLNNPKLPSTPFALVANNAANAGAIAVLFVTATQNATAVKASIPSATISPADAAYLTGLFPGGSATTDPATGAMSNFPLRLNRFFGVVFSGEMANFSSRGPVRGFGQVKPDVSAPGVNVLAAVPPASLLGALAQSNYSAISGTSMASPHAAGSAALVKQAHLNWSPDMIRTAMINSSTNLRNESDAAKADGLDADSVLAQGGGLIDVKRAVNLKALMGVTGDGISEPSILGSYSFGQVPVVNNRVTSAQQVSVTIQDLSGQGGTYNLAVANNRDLQLEGINVTTNPQVVTVPANGQATFTVSTSFNGDLLRDTMAAKTVNNQVVFEPIQMQWFITAQGNNGQSLRMPFYFKPVPSIPAAAILDNQTFPGTVLAGSNNRALQSGVDFVDVPINVTEATFKIQASMGFNQDAAEFTDLDFFLLDPDGRVIASSATEGNPETLSTLVFRPGTYRYRVTGYQNGPTDFSIDSSISTGPSAPTAQTIAGEFVNSQGQQVDFDGAVTLQWTPAGGELGFEIERSSTTNPDWELMAAVGGNTTSLAISDLADGEHSFRVRGIHSGQIGNYVTNAGNAASVLVDHRSKVDITNAVSQAISNISLMNGVFSLDLAMTNNSTQTYLPYVELNVVGVNSASGTVKVVNADNGKDGMSVANAALFGYSQQIGSDQLFSPGEVSGTRTMRFQDNASELFTFDAVVTAYLSTGGSGGAGAASAGSQTQSSGESGDPLTQIKAVMRFTANPLTKTVTTQLVTLKL